MKTVKRKRIRVACVTCGWHGYRLKRRTRWDVLEKGCPHCKSPSTAICDCGE